MNNKNEWLYSSSSTGRSGPVSLETLRALFLSNEINTTTLVSSGDGVWKKINEMPDLLEKLKAWSFGAEGIAEVEEEQRFAATVIRIVQEQEESRKVLVTQSFRTVDRITAQ